MVRLENLCRLVIVPTMGEVVLTMSVGLRPPMCVEVVNVRSMVGRDILSLWVTIRRSTLPVATV